MRAAGVGAAVAAALVAGCSKETSCEDAAANAARVLGPDGSGAPALIERCKREAWPETVRSCVKAAGDRAALDRCRKRREIADQVDGYNTYLKKAKHTEAELNLHAIQKGLEVYQIENGRYPTGKVAPTPPPGSCCQQRSGKCQPDPSLWDHEPWTELGFEVDEPHLYSYGYRSDGHQVEAVAIGDLDCDGTMATFTLTCDTRGCAVTATDPNE